MAYISESTVSITKVRSKPGSKTEGRGHRERRTHRSDGSHRKRKADQSAEKDEVVYVYRVPADHRGSAQDGNRRRSTAIIPPETPEMISRTATVKRVGSVRKRSIPEARRSPPEPPPILNRTARQDSLVTEKRPETTLRRSQSARYPPTRQLNGLSRTRTLRYVISVWTISRSTC